MGPRGYYTRRRNSRGCGAMRWESRKPTSRAPEGRFHKKCSADEHRPVAAGTRHTGCLMVEATTRSELALVVYRLTDVVALVASERIVVAAAVAAVAVAAAAVVGGAAAVAAAAFALGADWVGTGPQHRQRKRGRGRPPHQDAGN